MPSPDTAEDSPPAQTQLTNTRERFIRAFRWMLVTRLLEERLRSLYHAGRIVGGVYIGRGQEAFSTSSGVVLDRKKGDVFGPLIRDLGGRLAFGQPLLDHSRTYFGSAHGPMRGRDGNVHNGRPREGVPAMISHLGSLTSVICGMLFAKRFRGESGFAAVSSLGDGASSTGACHEALNLAGIEKLPLVVALANNHYAYSTPTDRQFACKNLAERAVGYGFTGHTVDGTDLSACLEVFSTAVAAARAGQGPQLVVGSLLRLSGHGEHDDSSYISEKHRAAAYGRDCMEVAVEQALAHSFATEEEIAAWKKEAATQVADAISTAQKESGPDPYSETWRALATAHLADGFFDA
ncbi:MAG: thiamine pyrophosphate-dependent dehydrogenase E1 component subunit alpha [Verrucomicrobiota bacterium]